MMNAYELTRIITILEVTVETRVTIKMGVTVETRVRR